MQEPFGLEAWTMHTPIILPGAKIQLLHRGMEMTKIELLTQIL